MKTKTGKPSMSYNARIERSLECHKILMAKGECSKMAYDNVLKMTEKARIKLIEDREA